MGTLFHGHVPPFVSCLFMVSRLEKQINNIQLGAIGKVTYWLVTYIFAIYCRDTFVEHFNPHKFGVVTWGRCETVVHKVCVMLDLHLD